MPTADDYAAAAPAARRAGSCSAAACWPALVAASFVAFGLDNLVLPRRCCWPSADPVLLWHFPRLPLYVTFAAVCLFELGLVTGRTAAVRRCPDRPGPVLLERQHDLPDLRARQLQGRPAQPVGGLHPRRRRLLLPARRLHRTTNLRGGPLFVPIGVYMAFVVLGWVNGMVTGRRLQDLAAGSALAVLLRCWRI